MFLKNCKSVLHKLQLYNNQNLPQILFRVCSKKLYSVLHHRVFPALFLQDISLQNFGKVCARYLCHSLSNKVEGLQSIGCNLLKRKCLTKTYRTNFYFQRKLLLTKRQYLYLNADAEMQCRDFQVTVLSIFKDKDIKDKSLS